MSYKKILTIQDISCVGQCSLTVALPILSACGLETSVLPSAVLSTHTAGFTGFTFRDLTEDMPAIMDHWCKENIRFQAIYTGYLGSIRQIGIVQEIFDRTAAPDCVPIVAPAMADNGIDLAANENLTRGDVAQVMYQVSYLARFAPGMAVLKMQK